MFTIYVPFHVSVTIISTIIMGILFLSEVNYYLTPTLSEELFVDTSRDSKLKINLDIIVPSISCDGRYRLFYEYKYIMSNTDMYIKLSAL